MSECKHRWVESNWFNKKYRKPTEYYFNCTRCLELRFVALIGSTAQ